MENIIRNPFSIFFLFFALVFFTGFVFSLKAKFVHRILFSQEGIDITPYDGDAMHLSSNEIQNIHVSEVYSNETHFTVISKKDFPALHSLLWLNMPYKQASEILTQCQFLQGQRLTSMNGMQQANFQFKLPNSI